jgi:N-acetylmuramoyl-L-alanine amidase
MNTSGSDKNHNNYTEHNKYQGNQMGRIFISAGHYTGDPGATSVIGTKEADEMMKTRDALIRELESRGLKQKQDFYSVPDSIDFVPSINWINNISNPNDVAIELHGNSSDSPARGTEAYFVEGNDQREADASKLLDFLIKAVPGLGNRKAKQDSDSQHPRLAFCRDVDCPSVLIELCFLTDQGDMNLLTNQRDKFAKGLADGLMAWSGTIPVTPLPIIYPSIDIEINGKQYSRQGILANGNALIPVGLAERDLSINLAQVVGIRRQQNGVVFVKAVDLQALNVAVSWNATTRTIVLTSSSVPATSDKIMGTGKATAAQLQSFMQANNPNALTTFPNLPQLYMAESALEGVNHDVAFAQMCLETGYLKFGGIVQASQNNFAGLGSAQGTTGMATFPDPQTGVKAHIQHLKAYASTAAVVPPIVDPRFDLVERGIAPLVTDLSGRWSVEPSFGNKILDIQKKLLAT